MRKTAPGPTPLTADQQEVIQHVLDKLNRLRQAAAALTGQLPLQTGSRS